jgi:monovalent cation:proton antiporter-2 (CPA2) family protein
MLVLQLALILAASKLAGNVSVRLGQPSVLGELLVGIVLGPAVLGVIHYTDILKEMSEIGVILLMFIAGLETDIKEFSRSGKASTLVAVGGIIAPLVGGYFLGEALRFSTEQSWFLGLLLSATSVSISVQALKEMDLLKSREGTAILGAAVLDDILVMMALAFFMSMIGGEVHFGTMVLTKVLFFTGAILAAWKAVPWILEKLASLKVAQSVLSAALIICFLYAFLADWAGVSAIIGAYMAGVAVSVTKWKSEVFEKTETISYSLFVPIFFTSVGVAAHFHGIGESFWLLVILSILAIFTKLIGASWGAKAAGFSWGSSLGIGASMVSRGEVALILANIGLEHQLVSQELFTILVVVVLITTIATPPMMKWFFMIGAPAKSLKNTK